jgi:ferredoxin
VSTQLEIQFRLTTDIGIVFAARLLVRFARLLPGALDLQQISSDLEELNHILSLCKRNFWATLMFVPDSHLADEVSQSLASARDIAGPSLRNTSAAETGLDMSNPGAMAPLYIPDLQYVEDLFRTDTGGLVSDCQECADCSSICLSTLIWRLSLPRLQPRTWEVVFSGRTSYCTMEGRCAEIAVATGTGQLCRYVL